MKRRAKKHQLSEEVRSAIRGSLLHFRAERDLTQADLAKMADVTQQAIAGAEKGVCGAELERSLLKAMGVLENDVVERFKRGEYDEAIATAEGPPGSSPRRGRARGAGLDIDLTDARRAALEAEDWDGQLPEEYEFVHTTIASERFASGIEPVNSYFRARIRELRAEFRGQRKRLVVTGDPNSPDSSVEAEKAARKARRAR